jgi:polyphosphate kinase
MSPPERSSPGNEVELPSTALAPSSEPTKLVPVAQAGIASPVPEFEGEPDLSAPELYLNRELTWLGFNYRVLQEAMDERTPLLERVKFLAIVGSNLDEFVMKRIGGLKQQVAAGVRTTSIDGRKPEEQIAECYEAIRDMLTRERSALGKIVAGLAERGIVVARYDDLDDEGRSLRRSRRRGALVAAGVL